MRKPLLAIVLILLAGCAERRYQGKPAGYWLDQLAHNSNATERWRAARALGTFGADARAAVPELSKALKSDDRILRYEAAAALGMIGPDARPAVPALEELRNDPSVPVRDAAESALKAINAPPEAGRKTP